jgi:UDP-N-acetylmuramoyl-tripeptide--D-alanyl-D-alanine ligase
MHELGASQEELHRAVGERAVEAGFELVVVVGDDPGIAEGAGAAAIRVADADAAAQALAGILRPGDVVLVKASRAAGLERVAEAIAGGDAA